MAHPDIPFVLVRNFAEGCAARAAALLLGFVLLAGCGSEPAERDAGSIAPQVETLTRGDITIRANALQTSLLGAGVADGYGIERDGDTVMLLVGVRRGEGSAEVSAPAQVSVTVTDLRGQRHVLPMRELRSGELVDHVGTVKVSLPDTLRFDVGIVHANGSKSTMQFSREFHPR